MNLKKYIDEKKLKEVLKHGIHKYYLSYPIPKKSGGRRWLDAPQDELKSLQEEILHNILYEFKPHESAVGFRRNISMIKGAKKHLKSEVILSLDIVDFFSSIKAPMIYTLFYWINYKLVNRKKPKLSKKDQGKIVNLLTYKKRLPQGAPTSPALSNLVFYKYDKALTELAENYNLTYTRYADDMSFSSINPSIDIKKVLPDIKDILEPDFKLNDKKTHVKRQHQRMTVTGIVVNEKLSVPKYKWRQFRAKLHNLKMSQKPISKLEHQKIVGYAQWINQLHPKRGKTFLKEIGKLNLKN